MFNRPPGPSKHPFGSSPNLSRENRERIACCATAPASSNPQRPANPPTRRLRKIRAKRTPLEIGVLRLCPPLKRPRKLLLCKWCTGDLFILSTIVKWGFLPVIWTVDCFVNEWDNRLVQIRIVFSIRKVTSCNQTISEIEHIRELEIGLEQCETIMPLKLYFNLLSICPFLYLLHSSC